MIAWFVRNSAKRKMRAKYEDGRGPTNYQQELDSVKCMIVYFPFELGKERIAKACLALQEIFPGTKIDIVLRKNGVRIQLNKLRKTKVFYLSDEHLNRAGLLKKGEIKSFQDRNYDLALNMSLQEDFTIEHALNTSDCNVVIGVSTQAEPDRFCDIVVRVSDTQRYEDSVIAKIAALKSGK